MLHVGTTNPGKVANAEVPDFLRGAEYDPAASKHHDFTQHVLANLDKLVVKAVAVGGTLYGAKDIERLASLPTMDQARSMLMGTMLAPISQFGYSKGSARYSKLASSRRVLP